MGVPAGFDAFLARSEAIPAGSEALSTGFEGLSIKSEALTAGSEVLSTGAEAISAGSEALLAKPLQESISLEGTVASIVVAISAGTGILGTVVLGVTKEVSTVNKKKKKKNLI